MISSETAGRAARRRATALVVGGVLLVLAGLCGRMLLSARAELALAAEADRRGDMDGRVRHLRRAMAHYLPGNPWVSAAHEQLLLLARTLSRRPESRRQALLAYEELRSAILMLRGLARPYAATLPEANRMITALSAGDSSGEDVLQGAALLARLEAPPEPHRGWTLAALLGFLIWVGAAVGLVLGALRPDATRIPGRFWPLLGVVALGWALFALGLRLA